MFSKDNRDLKFQTGNGNRKAIPLKIKHFYIILQMTCFGEP